MPKKTQREAAEQEGEAIRRVEIARSGRKNTAGEADESKDVERRGGGSDDGGIVAERRKCEAGRREKRAVASACGRDR